MGDREEAPPAWREYILSAEEIEEIERRVAWERRARRKKVPVWNPDTDPPWRWLEHCLIAALKGCNEISTKDVETVLARGKVCITGTRRDVIGDFLPDRIERLVAAADRRWFCFDSNSIRVMYEVPPVRGAPFRIDVNNVRVHWPMLVEALQEAGFKIRYELPRGAKPRVSRGKRSRPGPPQEPLRLAPELEINRAIQAVYDETEAGKEKPPNVVEIVTPVQARLRDAGFYASGRQIQKLADADQYKRRRRKIGVTVASEKKRKS
jgi:hypothetical protein